MCSPTIAAVAYINIRSFTTFDPSGKTSSSLFSKVPSEVEGKTCDPSKTYFYKGTR